MLLRQKQNLIFHSITRCISMGRVVPELDQELVHQIREGLDPKKIPTRRNINMIRIPIRLEAAAKLRIQQISDRRFREEVRDLQNIIRNAKLPDDNESLKAKKADIRNELDIRDKIPEETIHDPSKLNLSEEMVKSRSELHQIIQGILDTRRRDWHYFEYDDYASVLYMATRLMPNYASIKAVMSEIKAQNPTFEPKSVMDFGSGLGTTLWAVDETWPNVQKEFHNIELSKSQQTLCEFLLRGGTNHGESIPNLYQRQYLSTSTRTKYDLVVAAFSLLEQPTRQMRTHVIENLWNKTNDLLVIIELGNIGGFTVVDEARHLVLELAGHEVNKRISMSDQTKPRVNRKLPDAHVIAPCPHELYCPRINHTTKLDRNICRFKTSYDPIDIGQNPGGRKSNLYSYVVLRKGPHPNYTDEQAIPRWPRVVENQAKKSKHLYQRLCCPDGGLSEIVFTKKYGKELYELAKSCKWGDLIPIKVSDTYVSRSKSSSFNDVNDNKS